MRKDNAALVNDDNETIERLREDVELRDMRVLYLEKENVQLQKNNALRIQTDNESMERLKESVRTLLAQRACLVEVFDSTQQRRVLRVTGVKDNGRFHCVGAGITHRLDADDLCRAMKQYDQSNAGPVLSTATDLLRAVKVHVDIEGTQYRIKGIASNGDLIAENGPDTWIGISRKQFSHGYMSPTIELERTNVNQRFVLKQAQQQKEKLEKLLKDTKAKRDELAREKGEKSRALRQSQSDLIKAQQSIQTTLASALRMKSERDYIRNKMQDVTEGSRLEDAQKRHHAATKRCATLAEKLKRCLSDNQTLKGQMGRMARRSAKLVEEAANRVEQDYEYAEPGADDACERCNVRRTTEEPIG